MTRLVRLVVAVALALGAATAAHAQSGGSVAIFGPAGDTLRSVTPTFTVVATNFPTRPLRITLQLDDDPRFGDTPVYERTIEVADSGSVFQIAPTRALLEGARLYFRAVVTDASGATGTSLAAGPKIVPPWVTLVTPPTMPGQPVRTRTPRFVWRSPGVDAPPGPWQYTIEILQRGEVVLSADVRSDTTFVPGRDLEPNAFYQWRIRAALPRSTQSTLVISPFTFLVEDTNDPVAITDLYAPFPNPFPSTFTEASCIWFDLKNESTVNLDVYDLRGVHVRRLVPNGDLAGPLPAGRYGRGRTEFNEGCDQRITWDGTDDRGRPAPEGVYLIRFRADGIVRTKKVLFRGRT